MSNSPGRPALLFDHNVIEHLGIKLYQNKPANVLAELVANSWDADAERVWIDVQPSSGTVPAYIAVADDGVGMTLRTIDERYLVIGKAKRKSPKEKSPGGRAPMGRKGIGKLAPFGIAGRVDLATLAEGKVNWFTLELIGLKQAGADGRYEPTFSAEELAAGSDPTGGDPAICGIVTAFLNQVRGKGQGTLVLMTGLTPNELPDRLTTVTGLARRFTVILARSDFTIEVQGKKIEEAEALPEFELRIPDGSGAMSTELVDGKEVRFWAGFFAKAGPTIDEAGVGVFAHGKIAQDRPFFFKATGKEVFQRYLYAVVEADWLDELEVDLVSTDRTNIDWSNPATRHLALWGKEKVSRWLDAYTRHRNGMHAGETHKAAQKLRDSQLIAVFSDTENAAVESLVTNATRDLPKAQIDRAREELFIAVTKAWTNEPARRLIKAVWDDFVASGASPEQFESFASRLDEHSVPEAMNLALTFSQRAYALTVLHELVHRRSETKLQDLIEIFPWIIDPRSELLTANVTLKTTIERAADAAQDDKRYRAGRVIQGMSAAERADFVFLTDAEAKVIRIVEIKSPGQPELNSDHDRQLTDYMDFTNSFRSSSHIMGLLVGNRGSSRYESNDRRTVVKTWDEVLLECRAAYVDMLASMLGRSSLAPDDSRLALVQQFAGKEVWSLLQKVANKNDQLRRLMTQLTYLIDLPAPPDNQSGTAQS